MQINLPRYGSVFFNSETFADLRSIPTTQIAPGYSAIVKGSAAPADGFGGMYCWSPTSTAADDNQFTIAPSDGSTGRWLRIAVGQIGPQGNASTVPGPKGDPGGSPMAIGLFQQATALTIPAGTNLVQTSGFGTAGRGHGRYAADSTVNAAYVTAHPNAAFVDAAGRGFRLVERTLSPAMFGATGSGDETSALQSMLDYAALTSADVVIDGSYIASALNVRTNVRGNGTGKLKKLAGVDGILFHVVASFVTVSGLTFDGTATQPTLNPVNDIVRIEASHCIVDGNTITGSAGGGIAVYNGSDNIIRGNTVLNVHDNSIFLGGQGSDRNRIVNNVCNGTVAQNNIFITASPSSAAVPGIYVYDNIVEGNTCSNAGDTNIESGIHTVRSIIRNNSCQASVNPAILLRDSTYFIVSQNIIDGDGTHYNDFISVVPQTETAAWECHGLISQNTLIGTPSRSGIYLGQSRITVSENLISRYKRGDVPPADGSGLTGSGIILADATTSLRITGNRVRGYANAIDLNYAATVALPHPDTQILNNKLDYCNFAINFYSCVGDPDALIAHNTARYIKTCFLKGDNAIIVPTGSFPAAQLRCVNNTVTLSGYTGASPVIYSAGVTPQDGLLTTADAQLVLIPETTSGSVSLASQVLTGTGFISIRFVGGAVDGTFAVSQQLNISTKVTGSTVLYDNTGTDGWSLYGASGQWFLIRRGAATNNAARYAIVSIRSA